MTRTFSPRDVLRLHRMQASGVSFDLEGDVLLGRSPLPQALGALLPLPERSTATLVLDEGETGSPSGFVQGRRHRDGLSSEITFLAPGLEAASGAALAWQRLVGDLCAQAGAAGIRSLFVTIDSDSHVALQVFRSLSFHPFNGDTVLRLSATLDDEDMEHYGTTAGEALDEGRRLVPARPEHDQAIDGLLQATHPPAVRSALAERDHWRSSPLGGLPMRGEIAAVQLDGHGAPLGAWRLLPGREGHWLRVVTGPRGDSSQLVAEALRVLARSGWAALPVFASACGYEPELHLALRERGFEATSTRFRLIKHTTVRRLAPAWSEQPTALGAAHTRPAAQSRARAPHVHSPGSPL